MKNILKFAGLSCFALAICGVICAIGGGGTGSGIAASTTDYSTNTPNQSTRSEFSSMAEINSGTTDTSNTNRSNANFSTQSSNSLSGQAEATSTTPSDMANTGYLGGQVSEKSAAGLAPALKMQPNQNTTNGSLMQNPSTGTSYQTGQQLTMPGQSESLPNHRVPTNNPVGPDHATQQEQMTESQNTYLQN